MSREALGQGCGIHQSEAAHLNTSEEETNGGPQNPSLFKSESLFHRPNPKLRVLNCRFCSNHFLVQKLGSKLRDMAGKDGSSFIDKIPIGIS